METKSDNIKLVSMLTISITIATLATILIIGVILFAGEVSNNFRKWYGYATILFGTYVILIPLVFLAVKIEDTFQHKIDEREFGELK